MKLSPLLILIGVIFLASATINLYSVETEIGIDVLNEAAWWQFWIPRNYNIIQVPEYTITNLVIGTASLTAGITLLTQETRNKDQTPEPT